MPIEEAGDLLERFAGFRSGVVAQVVRVRLAFEDLERGLDAGLAQLAVDRTVLLESRSRVPLVRMAGGNRHVAVDRREQSGPSDRAIRIDRGVAEPVADDQHVVDQLFV